MKGHLGTVKTVTVCGVTVTDSVCTHVGSGVGRGLLAVEADVRHLDDVLQLARLLLDLGGEEERGGGDRVAVEPVEGVEHVEPLHVHDRSVDAQLSPERRRQSCLLFSSVGFRYGRIIRGQNVDVGWNVECATI